MYYVDVDIEAEMPASTNILLNPIKDLAGPL